MIQVPDLIISILYVLLIVGIGIYTGYRARRAPEGKTAGAYFLAGRSLRWPAIGLALFATNISTVHLVRADSTVGYSMGTSNGCRLSP